MNDENESKILAKIERVRQKYGIKRDLSFNKWLQDILSWIEIYKEEDKAVVRASLEKVCLQKLIKKANALYEELQVANTNGIEIFSNTYQSFCEKYKSPTHDMLECSKCSKARSSKDYDLDVMQEFIQKFISDMEIKKSFIPLVGKGRPSKKITYRLLGLLGEMYEEMSGIRVLFYWEVYGDRYVGDFDIFVLDILEILKMMAPTTMLDIDLYSLSRISLSEYIKRFLYEIYPKWHHKNQ